MNTVNIESSQIDPRNNFIEFNGVLFCKNLKIRKGMRIQKLKSKDIDVAHTECIVVNGVRFERYRSDRFEHVKDNIFIDKQPYQSVWLNGLNIDTKLFGAKNS